MNLSKFWSVYLITAFSVSFSLSLNGCGAGKGKVGKAGSGKLGASSFGFEKAAAIGQVKASLGLTADGEVETKVVTLDAKGNILSEGKVDAGEGLELRLSSAMKLLGGEFMIGTAVFDNGVVKSQHEADIELADGKLVQADCANLLRYKIDGTMTCFLKSRADFEKLREGSLRYLSGGEDVSKTGFLADGSLIAGAFKIKADGSIEQLMEVKINNQLSALADGSLVAYTDRVFKTGTSESIFCEVDYCIIGASRNAIAMKMADGSINIYSAGKEVVNYPAVDGADSLTFDVLVKTDTGFFGLGGSKGIYFDQASATYSKGAELLDGKIGKLLDIGDSKIVASTDDGKLHEIDLNGGLGLTVAEPTTRELASDVDVTLGMVKVQNSVMALTKGLLTTVDLVTGETKKSEIEGIDSVQAL